MRRETIEGADDLNSPKSSHAAAESRSRRQQAAIAGHTGDTGLARSLLADGDARVRATAAMALQRIGTLELSELEAALADPDAGVRRRAVEIVAVWPGDHAPRLVDHLRDPDAWVVEAAAWACGERTPVEGGVVEPLIEVATGHDDPLCREAAVAALGAIGDDAGLPAILAALDDKPAIRRRAVLALAPFEGPDVEAALRRAAQDKDWQTRQNAEDLL